MSVLMSNYALGCPIHARLTAQVVVFRAVRMGCGGCSAAVLGFMAVTAVVAVGGWAMTRTLQAPVVETVRFTREDGVRAQQKIVDLALHRTRSGAVLFSEAE